MKAYLITSGAVFGLVTLAHICRIFSEGPRVATNPFIVLTLAAAALCVWALRLLKWPAKKL